MCILAMAHMGGCKLSAGAQAMIVCPHADWRGWGQNLVAWAWSRLQLLRLASQHQPQPAQRTAGSICVGPPLHQPLDRQVPDYGDLSQTAVPCCLQVLHTLCPPQIN